MAAAVPTPGHRYREALAGHLPALDGIRGLAILLVLAHNFDLLSDYGRAIDRMVSLSTDVGWVGVQLFFVLSGFLITGVLFDTRGAKGYYRIFFARRALRILPLYYGTLVMAFVVLPLLTTRAPNGRNQIWLWTFMSNWAGAGHGVAAFPHFWSLAVEEQFYLLWPLCVRLLPPRRLVQFCAALALSALAIRCALRAMGSGPDPAYVWTICRMDALAAGAVIAIWLRMPERATWIERHRTLIARSAVALALVGAVVTRAFPRTSVVSQTVGYTILALVFAALVLGAATAEVHGGLLARVLGVAPLRLFGRYSYGMYVFHVPIHHVLGPRFAEAVGGPRLIGIRLDLAYMAGATALTLAVAALSYHLFEKRFLTLKRYFVAQPTAAAEPS